MKKQDEKPPRLFPGDSPASPFPAPGNKEDLRTNGIYGPKCSALSGNCTPLGCLEKMLLASSIWGSTRRFLTWSRQPVLAAHDKLTERQNKVGFQGQRVFILGVVQVDVQRVYIVFAGRRQFHHLPMQPIHKGVILGLWITDIHIVRGAEEHAHNLGFTAHTFAASRCPQL